jgi:hypothetical protein
VSQICPDIPELEPNWRSCLYADPMSATSAVSSAHCFVISVVHPWSSKEGISRKRAGKQLNSRFPRFGTLESGHHRPWRSPTIGQIALAGNRRTRLSWFDLCPSSAPGVHVCPFLIMATERGAKRMHPLQHSILVNYSLCP